MSITLTTNLRLELTTVHHAPSLYAAVDANRAHLSSFLPWVPNMQSEEDMLLYLYNCELLYQQNKELSFVIVLEDSIAGRIGLHHINHLEKSAAIGYWLTQNAEGQGIITRSCRVLLDHAFKVLHLERIEIRAATGNIKSQAIPERLHFIKEKILPQAEWVNNQCLDLFLYSMSAGDWNGTISKE